MATGIRKMHSTGCATEDGGRCHCNAGYEAAVYSPRDKKKIRKVFKGQAEARNWRHKTKQQLDQGTLRAPTATTLREAADAWLAGVQDGTILNRSGNPYKPSAQRGYSQALRDHVLPLLGSRKLAAITTSDLQSAVDRWQGEGTTASSIRNRVKPLQAIYRHYCAREGLAANPTRGLQLPAARYERPEIPALADALLLLDHVPAIDKPIWATAIYAGLRYGELRALRWGDVDLAGGRITVARSWDPKAGPITPKTRTSRRVVPMLGVLRDTLAEHRVQAARTADSDLVFGANGEPFVAERIYRCADAAWKAAGLKGRLRLHQCRHACASYMIAAGVNAKALSTFMGHSSIAFTYDRYGHLLPGGEAEAVALLDRYVAEGERVARGADPVQPSGGTGEQTGERDKQTA